MSGRRSGRAAAGLAVYFGVSFGLAWGLWAGLADEGWVPGAVNMDWRVLLGAFAPAVAAVAARAVDGTGFADARLGPRLVHGWPYYVLGLFLPLVGAVFVLGAADVFELAAVDWSLAKGLEFLPAGAATDTARQQGLATELLWLTCLLNAVVATPVLFGEEFGWRGYLQTRLRPDMPVLSAVSTGLVWAAWHLPLNLKGYNFPDAPLVGMAVFMVSCVLLSIVFGWLLRASHSIWCVSLAHAAVNTIAASLIFMAMGGQDLIASYLGVLGWIPLGAAAVWVLATGRLPWRESPGEGA